jgi:hypothetical protein
VCNEGSAFVLNFLKASQVELVFSHTLNGINAMKYKFPILSLKISRYKRANLDHFLSFNMNSMMKIYDSQIWEDRHISTTPE